MRDSMRQTSMFKSSFLGNIDELSWNLKSGSIFLFSCDHWYLCKPPPLEASAFLHRIWPENKEVIWPPGRDHRNNIPGWYFDLKQSVILHLAQLPAVLQPSKVCWSFTWGIVLATTAFERKFTKHQHPSTFQPRNSYWGNFNQMMFNWRVKVKM